MRMGTKSRGFTLIELMIVVAIIGILAAVALPAYRQYLMTSANNACLAEAKAYMTTAVADLASWQDAKAFTPGACVSISATPTMADFTGTGATSIDFTVKAPGERNTRCNPGTAICALL